jgi:antitoxin component YwqK of YwqJK toxin-antitoxin module
MQKFLILTLILSGITFSSFAQRKNKKGTETSDPDSSGVVAERLLPTTLPLLLFDDEEKKQKTREEKKKVKKNIYFGERTTKARTKQVFRNQIYWQFFHVVNVKRETDPYIRDVYWFDRSEKVIRKEKWDPSKGNLLHGPYEKYIDETLVESGNFYFGTRHGTWMFFDSKSILTDKLHFVEGWPRDSRVSYYNRAEKKVEKLIPIEYDLAEGNFFHFHENGTVAVTGEFRYGEKVGIWTEYWDHTSKTIRKREIQYQEQPFTKNFRPFIRAEWDKDGNLIYRKEGT